MAAGPVHAGGLGSDLSLRFPIVKLLDYATVSNYMGFETLKDLLQSSASSAAAARRLVNIVNLQGATDNATVVVVRVT